MNETKVISTLDLHSTRGNKSHTRENFLEGFFFFFLILGKKDISLGSSFTFLCFHLITYLFNYKFISEAQAGRMSIVVRVSHSRCRPWSHVIHKCPQVGKILLSFSSQSTEFFQKKSSLGIK